jgi:hypothetical protein
MVVQPVYLASDGSVLWNHAIVSDNILRRYMMEINSMNPEPQVILEVAPAAACARVTAVRAIMDETPMCSGRYSLCSEGGNWKQWRLNGP